MLPETNVDCSLLTSEHGAVAMRPPHMGKEVFGFLWPDGAPEKMPNNITLSFSGKDENGEIMRIAYTQEQIEAQVKKTGWFRPFFPLFISGLKTGVVIVFDREALAKYGDPKSENNKPEMLIARREKSLQLLAEMCGAHKVEYVDGDKHETYHLHTGNAVYTLDVGGNQFDGGWMNISKKVAE